MLIFISATILKIEYIREDNAIHNTTKTCKILLNKFNKKYIQLLEIKYKTLNITMGLKDDSNKLRNTLCIRWDEFTLEMCWFFPKQSVNSYNYYKILIIF